MPLSAGLFKSEHKNPVPQCPPRLHVQFLSHVLWSRMPNQFLKVDVSRISERQGWLVQCVEPLQFMSLHIPEENRSGPNIPYCPVGTYQIRPWPRSSGVLLGKQNGLYKMLISCGKAEIILHFPSFSLYLNSLLTERK